MPGDLHLSQGRQPLHRQIRSQFEGTRRIPCVAMDHENAAAATSLRPCGRNRRRSTSRRTGAGTSRIVSVTGLTPAADLLHGEETVVYADAGYQGIEKRPEMKGKAIGFRVAMRPGK